MKNLADMCPTMDADKAYVAWQLYVDRQEAVVREMEKCRLFRKPVLCQQHSVYFPVKPYVFPEE